MRRIFGKESGIGGDGNVGNWIVVGSVWATAFFCWRIMKKIQPELSELYLIYVLLICAIVTGFAIIRLSQV